MVNCVVKNCRNRSGKRVGNKGFVLHVFPSNLTKIKEWLRQTTQKYEDLEAFALKILADKRKCFFSMCSDHFTPDCYVMKGNKKNLKEEAVPTIFERPFKRPYLPLVEPASSRLNYVEPESSQAATLSILTLWSTIPTVQQTQGPVSSKCDASNQTDFSFMCIDHCTQGLDWGTTATADAHTARLDHCCSHHFTSLEEMSQVTYQQRTAHLEHLTPVKIEAVIPNAASTQPDHTEDGRISTLEKLETLSVTMKENCFSESSTMSAPFKTRVDDPGYTVHLSELQDSEMTIKEEAIETDYVKERKFIVFESSLDILFKRLFCAAGMNCCSPVQRVRKKVDGSLLSVTGYCESGHKFLLWESQPRVNQMAVGNVLTASAILFSGSNFRKVHEQNSILGLQQISEKMYHCYQRKYLYSVIDYHWNLEQQRVKEAKGQEPLCVARYGQCDSAGHPAKHLIYTVMDTHTRQILDFESVQSSQCTSTTTTEEAALKLIMDRLQLEKYKKEIVATDRHVSAHKVMCEKSSDVQHQSNVWHYAKRLKKKLVALSKEKMCCELKVWIGPLLEHFWWCVQTCKGSETLWTEKWNSLLMHVTDQHSWSHGSLYQKCAHRSLTTEERVNTSWLKRDSPAFENLRGFVMDAQLHRDFKHLVHYCHNRAIHVFHSLMLKYKPMRNNFQGDSREARTKLCVLAHNHNVQRNQSTFTCPRRTAQPLGTKKTKQVFPKSHKRWVVHTDYEPISIAHIEDMLNSVLRLCAGTLETSW